MNFLRNFDWLTLIVYVILVLAGWVTINAASYNFDGASILISVALRVSRLSGLAWHCSLSLPSFASTAGST